MSRESVDNPPPLVTIASCLRDDKDFNPFSFGLLAGNVRAPLELTMLFVLELLPDGYGLAPAVGEPLKRFRSALTGFFFPPSLSWPWYDPAI